LTVFEVCVSLARSGLYSGQLVCCVDPIAAAAAVDDDAEEDKTQADAPTSVVCKRS
jgi:hypothetical protein